VLLPDGYYLPLFALVNKYFLMRNGAAIGFGYGLGWRVWWPGGRVKAGRGRVEWRSLAALVVFLYHRNHERT
jgi:hypothetical protein